MAMTFQLWQQLTNSNVGELLDLSGDRQNECLVFGFSCRKAIISEERSDRGQALSPYSSRTSVSEAQLSRTLEHRVSIYR